MPTQPSLRVTDAYRARLQALVESASRDARSAWRGLEWEDIDASYRPIQVRVARSVERAQTEAVRLTAGYLGAFLTTELGEPVGTPPLAPRDYVGKSYGDLPLLESLDKPRIALLNANAARTPDPKGVGLRALLANVDLDVKGAARSALQDRIEADERIEGWQRAVKGTCGACMGAGASDGARMQIHPNCQCVSEPEVKAGKVKEGYGGRQTNIGGDDLETMQDYCASRESFELNDFLRYGTSKDPLATPEELVRVNRELKRLADRMDGVMARSAPLSRSVQAFRGLVVESPEQLQMKVGAVITDAGFGSTSASWRYTEKFLAGRAKEIGGEEIIMNLTVDPSVKAAWGANAKESELVLQRGCRYMITSMKKGTSKEGGGAIWRVNATVLPPA